MLKCLHMKVSDAGIYKLGVSVTDRAEPYNVREETLNIVVDGTGKSISPKGIKDNCY